MGQQKALKCLVFNSSGGKILTWIVTAYNLPTSATRSPKKKATVTSITVSAVVIVALFKNRQTKKKQTNRFSL